MARDRKVYGFRKARAEALLALPLSGDQEFPEMRPRGQRKRPEAAGWLLKTTESIAARSGTTLGSGDCIICTRTGSTIVETEDEITAYNSQNGDAIPSGAYVQAKLWQGVPLIDVVECD